MLRWVVDQVHFRHQSHAFLILSVSIRVQNIISFHIYQRANALEQHITEVQSQARCNLPISAHIQQLQ